MISAVEYHYLYIVTAHHLLQSDKHCSLIEKPSENQVGTKPGEKTVLFAMHS